MTKENGEHALTAREREIVALIIQAKSNKEIARELVITEGTVKVHIHRIFERLAMKNRTMLAMTMGGANAQIE